jgi:predicted MPP superfamily phosphohydrolase
MAAGAILTAGVTGYAAMEARRTPIVRDAAVTLPGYRMGAAPLTIVLMTDIHVAGPDMPPERLARIVRQVNALRPDLVLIAGDLVSDKRVATRVYPTEVAIAPLAALRPRLGTLAVLGNHDHARGAGAVRAALTAAGIVVLDNRAARMGPVTVAGVDDDFTGHADIQATRTSAAALGQPIIALSHSPDVFPALGGVALTLAGHTHCGQARLPLIGPVVTFSRFGDRYACGLIREEGRVLVTGAGLGTSLLPLRLGAPPDLWRIQAGAAPMGRGDNSLRN